MRECRSVSLERGYGKFFQFPGRHSTARTRASIPFVSEPTSYSACFGILDSRFLITVGGKLDECPLFLHASNPVQGTIARRPQFYLIEHNPQLLTLPYVDFLFQRGNENPSKSEKFVPNFFARNHYRIFKWRRARESNPAVKI